MLLNSLPPTKGESCTIVYAEAVVIEVKYDRAAALNAWFTRVSEDIVAESLHGGQLDWGAEWRIGGFGGRLLGWSDGCLF